MEPVAPQCPGPGALSASRYAWVLIEASRPHFFAFPVGAMLAGLSTNPAPTATSSVILCCAVAGLGWGVGQLMNDVLDREADRIDAPGRPAVRGLLPARLTLFVAAAIGLGLVAVLQGLHSKGWVLGLLSMVLILTYNKCKAWPGGGNLSHGILMSLACLIGAGVAAPAVPLLTIMRDHAATLALTGTCAALYLQSNYEKDMRGDAVAGYRTLAHVLGVRTSAALRAGSSILWTTAALLCTDVLLPQVQLLLTGGLLSFSAVRVSRQGTVGAALQGYGAAVHSGTLGMLALGATAVPLWIFGTLSAVAVLLTEAAFRRTANP
jgi:geranylgeranylglycerol-phosphate geranylgeranyltransferase